MFWLYARSARANITQSIFTINSKGAAPCPDLYSGVGIGLEPKNRAELELVIRTERSSWLELVEQFEHIELPTDIGLGLMTHC